MLSCLHHMPAMLISYLSFLIKLEVSRLLAVFHCRFASLVIGSSSTFCNAGRSNLVDDIRYGRRLRFRESGAGNVADGAQRTSFFTTSSVGLRLMQGRAASHCPSRLNTSLS